jgi:hypothetical protein
MNSKDEIIATIDSFYRIISGKTTEARAWNLFRELFYTNAHLTSMRYNINNECVAAPVDVETYIEGLEKFLKTKDFYEYGFSYEIRIMANIAQVYSEYEAKLSLEDKEPIKKGVNLIQFVNAGDGWKIVSMVWQDC